MPVPYAAGFRHDPDLGRLVGFEEDPDEDGVREHIRRIAKRAEDGEAVEWAIADPSDGAFWGSLLLHHVIPRYRRCEVGFWVIPAVRRRGVASRAVTLAVTYPTRK